MSGASRLVYFDAGVFIAWLQGENGPTAAEDLDGIAYHLEMFDAGRSTIVTSVVTRIEVLDAKLLPDQRKEFESSLSKRRTVVAGVNTPVANLAHQIRSHYSGLAAGPGTPSTPDSIHLATAINYECDLFLTFDGRDGKQRRGAPLLGLESPIAGRHHIKIEVPSRPDAADGQFGFDY